MLTETWLRSQLDAEIKIDNYSVFRADRNRPKKRYGRNSGGVAIYVRNDIAAKAEISLEYSSGVIEALALKIPSLNMLVSLIYRQPNDAAGGNISTSAQFSELLQTLTGEINSLSSPEPTIVIAGDLNLPHAKWPACEAGPGSTADEKQMISLMQEFANQHFLMQMVTEPTHRAGNVLDVIFTNASDIFPKIEVLPSYPISSHHLIRCAILTNGEDRNQSLSNLNHTCFDSVNLYSEKTDWTKIKTEIANKDWQSDFENKSPDEMLHSLIDTCEQIVVAHAPKRKRKSKAIRSPVPRQRKILMRKRTRLRKQYQKASSATRKTSTQKMLENVERQLQDSYKEQESFEERKAVEAIKKNPKFFFAYARKKGVIKTPVGPLQNEEGISVSDPLGMANLLAEQFQKSFSTPTQAVPENTDEEGPETDDIIFSENCIIKAIDEISTNSSPGPDRFPALLLKKCKYELAKPLYILWRKSLDTGVIPDQLKISNITPIFKGGSRQIPKNYRPVALTSHLIKVFEKILRNHLVIFIERNNLMNPNQHGFRAGHSCLSQLIQHFDRITQLLEEGENADVVYLDFTKAFDKLDFDVTLEKLKNIGIKGKLHRWIKSFLTGRKQFVLVEGEKSLEVLVKSGVPQGSVVGPLLFLILLKDIDKEVSSSWVSSFADDTRVLAGVKNSEDVQKLQADLNTIYRWAEENNCMFNPDKFECLRYGNDNSLKESTNYTSSNEVSIACKDSVRDLGVQMSADAQFKDHISNSIVSANLKCGWVLRSFVTRDKLPMLTLWKSLILPILDYCCPLWCPHKPGMIQSLEMVQVSFVNKIAGMYEHDYWQQLKILKLNSLERRRERYVAIYIWKLLEGLVPNFGIHEGQNKRKGRYCIVPIVKTKGSAKIQTLRFNSFGVRGPRIFNCLPQKLRDMSGCSLDTFKRALDNHLKTIPDEPRVGKLIKYCSKGSNSLLEY